MAKARVEQAFQMHQRVEDEIQHMLQDEVNNLRRLNIKLAADTIQGVCCGGAPRIVLCFVMSCGGFSSTQCLIFSVYRSQFGSDACLIFEVLLF